jgi:UDP-galactopyranose mutase
MSKDIIAIAGAGFSGAVIARQLAEAGYRVDVFDPRPHVAGNCHTERDAETGVLVHRYGPHIFHTADTEVWDFVNRFGQFKNFRHRVRATVAGRTYGLPVNLTTINDFFGVQLDPEEARAFIARLGEGGPDLPANFEEQGLRFIGRDLYQAFFEGYTRKQWGMEPRLLPASILKRLPVRFDRNDEYFNHPYQAMPSAGYTPIVEAMLAAPGVSLHLGETFRRNDAGEYGHVFYTGPLDGYFDYQLGRLAYRTLDFEHHRKQGDHQGCAVMNYCDQSVPYTRITEHKHFAPWEKHGGTIYSKEFSRAASAGDTPYYPVRLAGADPLLSAYVELARREKGVTFVGRLATYRYLDMDVCIGEALRCVREFLISRASGVAPAAFSTDPLAHG